MKFLHYYTEDLLVDHPYFSVG